ncbi:EXOIII protein, partial [Rhizoctonia solani]
MTTESLPNFGVELTASSRKRKPSPPSLSSPPSPSAPSAPLKSPPGDTPSKTDKRKNKKLKKAETKAQNDKPPSLSFAGGELRKRKGPISVENPRSILRAVLLLVPGISPEAVGAVDPPYGSAYPIAIGATGASKIPSINSCYSHACPTRATGELTKMHSVLTTLLQSPISSEQKRKRLLERQQQKFSNDDPSMYLLDTPDMLDNGYPVPSYLGEGLSANPESVRATSSWPVAAPTPQTRENGWVETPQTTRDGALKAVAIDCEMCETEDGKVLARVCAVDFYSDKVVYDQLVLPDKPVIDYLTQYVPDANQTCPNVFAHPPVSFRFSGITAEQLASVTHKLPDAQAGLLELIDKDTIIIGHSLENDLRALKLAHPRCIDTSIIYKHPRGAPYKPGLKWLAQKWLNLDIQMKQGGHDPEEDARACLALLAKKLKEGPDFGVFKQDVESIFERLSKSNGRHGKGSTSAVIDHGNPRAWHGAKATSAVSCQTDDQVVTGVIDAARNHDFVFGRLLELSQALGWTTPRTQPNASASPAPTPTPTEPDPSTLESAYADLNSRITTIHKSLPAGTVLCIMSGNGDPRQMSALNMKKSRWDGMMREGKRPEDIPRPSGGPWNKAGFWRMRPNGQNGVTATEFPGVYPGEDHSWDFDKFKEAMRGADDEAVDFDLVGVDASIANAFRRILIAEVPTVAIENVYIWNNTSVIQDEVLAHRLGLVPIRADPALLDFPDSAVGPTDRNTLVFKLSVTCSRNPGVPKDETDPAVLYKNANVLSGHMEWNGVGEQVNDFGNNPPRPHNPKILLAKLRPGQELEMELHCVKGVGQDHAKFSPVATASYRLMPHVIFRQPIPPHLCDKFVSCFPSGVFAVEQGANGQKKVVAKDMRKDTVSREVLRHKEFEGMIELTRIRDFFM